MGRLLKRVSMDYDYELNEGWKGYLASEYSGDHEGWFTSCEECAKAGNECDEGASYCLYKNEDKWFYDPPEGEGFQLWENTSEGSPVSPVFNTLDELCQYAEKNCVVFADNFISKEEWYDMLNKDGKTHHTVGNITFI